SLGPLNHFGFRNTPNLPNGYSISEWVNGETRIVKDNSTSGSGELFAFMWSDKAGDNTLYLITSSDNGQSWNYITSHSNSAYRVQAMTQDSTGRVHAIAWATGTDSGSYLGISLSYASKKISGFSVITSIALPDHGRTGDELRADIKIVKNNAGIDTLMYEVNMGILPGRPLRDMKAYMSYAKNLAPASAADFLKMDGSGSGDTLVFDSCTYNSGSYCLSGGSVSTFSNHVHTALFSQNQQTRDIYLFQGSIEADWGISYGGAIDWITYTRMTSTSGNAWIIGENGTIDTNVDTTPGLSYAPSLFSVASGTQYAWVMFSDPRNGVRFGHFNSSNQFIEMASPEIAKDRSGWGVFNVSADDSKIWSIWYTLSSSCLGSGSMIACGSPSIAQAYYDGNAWTVFPDPIVSDIYSILANYSTGMAGVSGWTNGAAALLLNGHGVANAPEQPVAATIWSN
ncbi:MAG: hypothetical protein ABUL58_01995, partial [Steroidobacter sp.]